jgi:hypothetical protein
MNSTGVSDARAAFHVLTALLHAITVTGAAHSLWPRPAWLDGFPVPPPIINLNEQQEEEKEDGQPQQPAQPQPQDPPAVAPNLAVGMAQAGLAANAIMPPAMGTGAGGPGPVVPLFRAVYPSTTAKDEINILSGSSHAPGARYARANDASQLHSYLFAEIVPTLIRMEYSNLK